MMFEEKIIALIAWLVCGVIGYFYFGYKTKWKEYRYDDVDFNYYALRFIISTFCGLYTLMVVLNVNYKINENENEAF